MTAVADPGQRRRDRADQVEHLRRRIAAVSAKTGRGHSAEHRADEVVPSPESLLALPRGAVAVASGARSLLLKVVSATTAAGGQVAVVGLPDIGLLAAVEMGADLSRLALVPDPGTDPVEVAAVLMDGMDLVVLSLGGRSVPMSRTRAVTARARNKGCTLVVTGGDWQGARLRLEARVEGYDVGGAAGPATSGSGRILGVQLAIRPTHVRENRAITGHSALA